MKTVDELIHERVTALLAQRPKTTREQIEAASRILARPRTRRPIAA